MAERLTWEQITERYPDEWVILTDPEYTAGLEPVAATVAFHSKDQAAAWGFFERLPAKRAAIDFTGEELPAVDFAYIL